jgi:hypothetical protein
MTAERQWVFSPRGFNDVEQEITEADQFNTETVPGRKRSSAKPRRIPRMRVIVNARNQSSCG